MDSFGFFSPEPVVQQPPWCPLFRPPIIGSKSGFGKSGRLSFSDVIFDIHLVGETPIKEFFPDKLRPPTDG
jgi:hypothetical protein